MNIYPRIRGLQRALIVVLALGVALAPNGALSPVLAAGSGSARQSISGFTPPYTAVVGDLVTLSASASSSLPVVYSTDTPDVCSLTGPQVTMIQAGTCLVAAGQEGDATWAAASPRTFSIEVSAVGYHAVATVTAPDGSIRTDGHAYVGDRLDLRLNLDAGQILRCQLSVRALFGQMFFDGLIDPDGSCFAYLTVPAPPDMSAFPADGVIGQDLIVMAQDVQTTAGSAQMKTTDRKGQRWSAIGFIYDGTGDLSVPFSSAPQMVSANMNDWGLNSSSKLEFNTDLSIQLPSWVTDCVMMINGSWQTAVGTQRLPGCATWDLRLPGVLPAATPQGEHPSGWGAALWVTYLDSDGRMQQTYSSHYIPFAPSDGIFRSSLGGVVPADPSTARFVTSGDQWTPTFHVVGIGNAVPPIGTVCSLTAFSDEGWDWPQLRDIPDGGNWGTIAEVGTDANGDCAFSIAIPYTGTTVDMGIHQYWVGVGFAGTLGVYASPISAVGLPTPPIVVDPLPNPDGSTQVDAEPGEGQGVSLEVTVAPEVTPAIQARQHNLALAAEAESTVCASVAYTADFEHGGNVPNATAKCSLAPGRYVVTARMVDVTGKVRTTTRRVVILPNARARATVKPTVRGTATVGKTLTAAKGTWTGYPTPTFRYQWYVCTKAVTVARSTVPSTCKRISGATRSTFKLTSAQRGKYVAVLVTGTSLRTTATTWLSKTTAKIK